MATLMKCLLVVVAALFISLAPFDTVHAADPGGGAGLLKIDMGQGENPGRMSVVLQIFLLLTVLSLARVRSR